MNQNVAKVKIIYCIFIVPQEYLIYINTENGFSRYPLESKVYTVVCPLVIKIHFKDLVSIDHKRFDLFRFALFKLATFCAKIILIDF